MHVLLLTHSSNDDSLSAIYANISLFVGDDKFKSLLDDIRSQCYGRFYSPYKAYLCKY